MALHVPTMYVATYILDIRQLLIKMYVDTWTLTHRRHQVRMTWRAGPRCSRSSPAGRSTR
jgi:hypothetical protein